MNAATPEMREAVAAERALRRADPLRAAIAGLTRKIHYCVQKAR